MNKLTKNRRSKSRHASNRQSGENARFIPHGARVWSSKWGSGICARDGYLITDGQPFPTLIAWTEDFQMVRAFLECRVGMEDMVDLAQNYRGMFCEGIGANLLFPVNPKTGELICNDNAFAAAHFVRSAHTSEAIAFCVLTMSGLSAVSRDIELATFHHDRRNAGRIDRART